jgi:hypothetical protein
VVIKKYSNDAAIEVAVLWLLQTFNMALKIALNPLEKDNFPPFPKTNCHSEVYTIGFCWIYDMPGAWRTTRYYDHQLSPSYKSYSSGFKQPVRTWYHIVYMNIYYKNL